MIAIGRQYKSMLRDVNCAAAIDELFIVGSIGSSHHSTLLDGHIESQFHCYFTLSTIGSFGKKTTHLAHVYLGNMHFTLAMIAHLHAFHFSIILIISLIPLFFVAPLLPFPSLPPCSAVGIRSVSVVSPLFYSMAAFCQLSLVIISSGIAVILHQQNVFLSLGASGSVWELSDQNSRVVESQSCLDQCSGFQVHQGSAGNNSVRT